MACPTCDHTMAAIFTAEDQGVTVFQCPRCGSSYVELPGETSAVYVPTLVERCREFEATAKDLMADMILLRWHQLGIAEAINLPEDRPEKANPVPQEFIVAEVSVMTPEMHKERHQMLHRCLDELVADYMAHTAHRPGTTTVLELMQWSSQQLQNPKFPEEK